VISINLLHLVAVVEGLRRQLLAAVALMQLLLLVTGGTTIWLYLFGARFGEHSCIASHELELYHPRNLCLGLPHECLRFELLDHLSVLDLLTAANWLLCFRKYLADFCFYKNCSVFSYLLMFMFL
jgi:hypothetical protein